MFSCSFWMTGRLTDGKGRTVDFRNTVVIMTSNLGSQLWMNGKDDVNRDELTAMLQAHFRPEFLNRIDEILVFHSLSKEDLRKIVKIQLRNVTRLMLSRGFYLEVTQEAEDYLSEIGYSPDYGPGRSSGPSSVIYKTPWPCMCFPVISMPEIPFGSV